MADVHRQLQEYLSQGRAGGGPEAAEPLLGAGQAAGAGGPPWTWRWPWPRGGSEPGAGAACVAGGARAQRLAAGGVCLLLAALCFGLALLMAPALLLRARKFALLWALGSALGLAGGALLRGGAAGAAVPAGPALLYLGALAATLYAALGLRSAGLAALGGCAQVGALLAALLGLLPRGARPALRLALGRLAPGARVSGALPV
ncbi:vesicle transport protein SFT2C [Erinaceus europaeus]|uniref:Vesicle transport protein n=1 Tax=Erinaceus europaeus TaxID=9365 RepID=A0ABM3WC41_ERIEU|nr:vesicle transport protein SFT2C [Erinaceus europaeus]